MEKSKAVAYIDPSGKEHVLLVTAINGLNEGFISGVYVDASAPENDNVRKVFDVPHMSHPSRQEVRTTPVSDPARAAVGEVEVEGNIDLPSYPLNCWKELGEQHLALPPDHPHFDHPFATFEEDPERRAAIAVTGGKPIPAERPEYEKHIAAHNAPAVGETASVASSATPEPTAAEPPKAAAESADQGDSGEETVTPKPETIQ